MYLSKRCPLLLDSFLEGWYLGKGTVADFSDLRDFEKWLAEKYHVRSSHSWAEILLFFSEDGVEAFEKFYKLLDEYRVHMKKGLISAR